MASKKKAKKKSLKNTERLKPRQAKFVDGIVDGKSARQAALDAGYAEHTANKPADIIETKSMRAVLQGLLATPEKIAQRINEGLDAMKTEFAKFEGQISDKVDCVDFAERRQYAELACKLKELLPSAEDRGSLDNPMIVRIDC
jgi:hypothetical protein